MDADQRLLTAFGPLTSPARTRASQRPPLRLGLVQERWHADRDEHLDALSMGIRTAARQGASIVCLQELTLSPYFAITPDGPDAAGAAPEALTSGPTFAFVSAVAAELGIHVHASLFERADGVGGSESPDGLGYNTAIVVGADGELVSRTRKLHIPITAGYYEDKYFRPGPAVDDAYPLTPLSYGDGEGSLAQLACPTCWDQWFPELARAYSLEGAEVIIVQAPRDEPAVLVADLDLDQRRDWLELFPFLTTRRPDTYELLTRPRSPDRPW
jgi:N-carbamoylputrescine amidase